MEDEPSVLLSVTAEESGLTREQLDRPAVDSRVRAEPGELMALGPLTRRSRARFMATPHHVGDNRISPGLQPMREGRGTADATVLELL
uniref:Uncharacterized protein n=1 Tax=Streptomyces sp. NBC_00148 TaxID=2903626 RepID=A0AAU1M2E8_9ACTN